VSRSANYELAQENFENKIADFAGSRYAVLCSSGRTAILYSLLALGIKPGHEVVIPDYSCQILPVAVFCTGAKPKFCDTKINTIAPSLANLSKVLNRKTKAVILIHPFGIPIDPTPFLEITQEKGVALVEDAAQALGATIRGKKAGSFGDVGIFTFNKFLDVNSGGASVTDSQEIAEKLKLIRQALETKSYFTSICYRTLKFLGSESKKLVQSVFSVDNYLHQLRVKFEKKRFRVVGGWVEIGPYADEIRNSKALTNALMAYSGIQKNYTRRKLETLELSILESEFENLEKHLQKRESLAKLYEANLKLKEGCLTKICVPKHSIASYMRYPILFSDERRRSICINNLFKIGYAIDYTYEPLHTSPFFSLESRSLPLSESIYLSKHLLPLPMRPSLSQSDVERITSVINSSAIPAEIPESQGSSIE
jgi:dTDP-4-amino-4,6-dideoxygalactose transaminase